jgi:hypothetical protein
MEEPVKPLTTAGKSSLAAVAGLGVEEGAGGFGGGDQFLGGALAHALGLAVAPDIGGQDGLVPLVDQIAHGLADEVARDGVAGEAVVRQQLPTFPPVFREVAAASTSKWSPQQASSTPS